MDKVIPILTANLFPLWMITANLIARLGGMIILLLIGHAFAPDILGSYFLILAMVGLAVTATQAGTGPLLVRLVQTGSTIKVILTVIVRLLIALVAIMLLATRREFDATMHWPFLIMPVAAALSPDWVISARTEFPRLGLITVIAQLAGIGMALLAVATNNNAILFAITPMISVGAFIAAICFAMRSQISRQSFIASQELGCKQTIGLIGFTLLAGFLPNLDFVLLGNGDDTLFLAQRVFLFCAGLITAISATLFAKQQSGLVREFWLFAPMICVTATLLIFPVQVAHLIYATPDSGLISILRSGAFWPLLLAVIARQCLVLQETGHAIWLGWLLLIALLASSTLIPEPLETFDVIMAAQMRLALISLILAGSQIWLVRKGAYP
ncbi:MULTISPECIES: hypothetical protein [Thalassospira]|uniref:Polysaccharide biosynthesis protein n=2 Tax=Thalassospira TaxID=168934 RepID=A0A367W940_9PROT|nr:MULTISPECIES: hypothetical protein [Thalassospira]MDG4718170.1 hypothetical protein [Thalassospira sp. FZY0004]RCK37933.1 hypothetical protein TH19_07900 [Thalassospira profundimaris]